jgi:hypothetical protein
MLFQQLWSTASTRFASTLNNAARPSMMNQGSSILSARFENSTFFGPVNENTNYILKYQFGCIP